VSVAGVILLVILVILVIGPVALVAEHVLAVAAAGEPWWVVALFALICAALLVLYWASA
jgi:hypothetical protein